MSQNVWTTIMPFGPVTLIFNWPKKKFSGTDVAPLGHILLIPTQLVFASIT